MTELEVVQRWMDEHGVGGGAIEDARPLGGGTQNVMTVFSRGTDRYVFRRGPRHVRPSTNRALLREMRILGALAATDVPHPRLVASCSDPEVLGDSVFYLMEPVDGLNVVDELSAVHQESAQVRREMGLRMVDALTVLHDLDADEIGLGDLGRPAGFHDRQVDRWLAELSSYEKLPGYEGHAIHGLPAITSWLDRHRPRSWQPGLMHGDFHLGNVMFERGGPDVAAIVDWEMCTLGDPLLDLGWMLSLWAGPGEDVDQLNSALSRAGAVVGPDDLIERYAVRTRRDLFDLAWYRVLACFKLGIVLEGTYARSRAGKANAEVGARMRATTTMLFDRAHALVSGSD